LALLDHASAVGVLNAALQQVRRSGRAGVAAQFHALLCLAYARGEDHLEAAVQERLALEGLSPDLEEDVRLDVLLPLAEAAESLGKSDVAEERARTAQSLADRGARPHTRARVLRLLAEA